MSDLFVVTVVETETGEVIKSFGPFSERKANKIEDGVGANLNHRRYHTTLTEAPF